MLRTRTILKTSRWLRAVLEKLTFPEDVIVTVDVDPYHFVVADCRSNDIDFFKQSLVKGTITLTTHVYV